MSKTEASTKAPEKGERVSYELVRIVTRPDGSIDHERTALLDPSSAWDDECATLHRLVELLDTVNADRQFNAASTLDWVACKFEKFRGEAEDARDWVIEVNDALAYLEDDFGPTLRRIVGVDAE